MNRKTVSVLSRNFLTFLGGAIAARYAIEGITIDAVSSAFLTLIGIAWSIYDKRK